MKKENRLNVLVVDDHKMLIDGLNLLLKKSHFFDNFYQASNGEEALDIIAANQIDMVISDINMPVMSGIELTRIIKEKYPVIKILILTMYNDPSIIQEILNSEAEGYILKNSGKDELIKAISRIADNGTYYSNEAINLLKDEPKKIAQPEKRDTSSDLTTREIEILRLVCNELSSAEIAEKLFISKFTVDTHRKNILNKTNSKTIVSLIRFAIDNKII